MNTSQNKIPIAEFREVKFVPTVLLLKSDLNPATQQRERQPENHQAQRLRAGVENSAGWFGRSAFVRTAGPILPATPATFAEEQRKTPGL